MKKRLEIRGFYDPIIVFNFFNSSKDPNVKAFFKVLML